jgi:hypothetical protein
MPDLESARRTANDLLLARIEDRYMHFLARRGTDLGELHEAGVSQKSDLTHGAQLGLALGAACGFAVSVVLLLLAAPEVAEPDLTNVLVTSLVGALLGTWIGSLIGASTPNSRLKQFAEEIEGGNILLMVDVPKGRVEEIRALVTQRHPEVTPRGMEPTIPAFP